MSGTVPASKVEAEKGSFIKNRQYTRGEIRKILGVEGSKGGKWDTVHVTHSGENYMFYNVAIAGRMRHHYINSDAKLEAACAPIRKAYELVGNEV